MGNSSELLTGKSMHTSFPGFYCLGKSQDPTGGKSCSVRGQRSLSYSGKCKVISVPRGTNSTSASVTTRRTEQPGERENDRRGPRKNVNLSGNQRAPELRTGKSYAENLGDWSKGWPGGEMALNGWVEMLELNSGIARQFAQSYNPDKLTEIIGERPQETSIRAWSILTSFGRFATSLLLDKQTGKEGKARHRQRAKELCRILCQLGPSFIKVGQSLSVRPDICPPEYIEEFSELQDRIPSFPSSLAYALIKEELGCEVDELFQNLSPGPIAAASLGQVYKGQLRSNGEIVAVKVQRPGIGDNIAMDIFLVRKLVSWFDSKAPSGSSNLVAIVDELASRLFMELDYVREGQNAERFEALYGSAPHIRVPKIYWDYTTRRVLVMEWIDGVKLTDRCAMLSNGLRAVDFVDLGVNCTLRQLLEHGYFHADPHPGNLMATREGDLVYLDFGMMSEVPQIARYGIMEHVVHLVNREYVSMAQDYYTLGFLDSNVDVSPIVPELARFFDDVLDKSVSQLNFKTIIDGLGDVLYKFPFQVPAYYALITRSLTVLEGIALRADPQYKLIGRAYPYIAKRLLTDDAQELRMILQDFLIKDGSFRWSRLEGLIKEGRKQGQINEEQLWDILHWLVSEQKAGRIREALVHDLTQMLDAIGLNATRSAASSLARALSVSDQDAKIVLDEALPMDWAERQALARALLLQESVGISSQSSSVEDSPKQVMPWEAVGEMISNVASTVEKLRQYTIPEIQRLADSPRLSDMANEIVKGLMTRMGARALRVLLRENKKSEP